MLPVLTREAVFDALYQRRCYATTGARIYLDWRIADHRMGSQIEWSEGRPVPYRATVMGCALLARVELVRPDGCEALFVCDGRDCVSIEAQVRHPLPGWAYLRVTQVDRHMAWSSPVWFHAAARATPARA